MSEGVNTASTTSPSTTVATGDATGTSPATATVSATQGGDVGSATSPGGSSSAPARTSESETPQVDGQINDLPDDNANLAGSGDSSLKNTARGSGSEFSEDAPGIFRPRTFGAPRLLSTEEVDRLFHQGLVTTTGDPVTALGDSDIPQNYIAPHIEPEGHAFLVSAPARAEDFRRGRHVANAYGGPCVLVGYETLTDDDLRELERVIPSFDPDEVVTPRAQTPHVRTLETLVSSVEARRELASLLSHVPPTRLAEKVFRTAGCLKLMNAAHRRLRERVGSQNGVALIDAAAARSECEEIKREWVLNCQYWKHGLQSAQQDVDIVGDRMASEIQDLKAHYQDQVEALKADKETLKSKIADLQAQVSILKSRPDVKPMDPWGFSEFLQENSEISGNWDRLHDLLVSYQENTIVPDNWTTIINVTALDARKKPVPDFKKRLSEERDRQAAEETAKATRVLDLTRPSTETSESKSESPRYLSYSSKSPAPKLSPKRPFKSDLRNLQRRPSGHKPVEDSVLSANAGTKVAKSEVYKKLPGAVVWKEVRPDLRQALLSGVAYDKAMKWLASDKEAHSLFSSPALVQMLVSVIFSRHLDSTPWAKYVPEVYYQMADEVVDRHISSGTEPAAWGDLDGHVNYTESDVESTVDDPKVDPDYKDPGAVDSESEDDDEDEDEDSDDGKAGDSDSGSDKSKSKRSGSKKSDDHSRSGSKRPRGSDDDSDPDDGPIIPTKKSKRSRASVIAHTTPKSRPRSSSGSGSKSKGSSGKSRSLVSKPYKSLTVKELQVVETPDCDAFSWLYYGIRVQRVSSTKTTTGQTLGFPDYEVHKHSCAILKKRWDSERYCAVIRKKPAPWQVMFDNRFSEFYFHKRDELGPMVLADVEEIIRSMKKHAQAFWERTHWVTMDTEADDKSAELHKYRAMRRAAMIRQHNALIRKVLGHKDFPESLLSEPGIWAVPDKACPWIWQDPRVAELGGPKCLSLETQLGDLDAIEPARMQWTTVNVDEEWLQYVSDDIKRDHLTPTERSENPISLRY
ncbi:hypothetical protein P3T76_001626 [Phytophthora citrophthora]|uniref:Uncharacterized protein n=1 Tax=Phytophthora citrophthora TaxID=4793 RepID=A0AAD9LT27_9STRA|nr:hypothetical protein P3T76_001626 [Phytophthora citrophthora]